MSNLGKLGRDKVSGFEGVIFARTEYLHGSAQYYLVPKAQAGQPQGVNVTPSGKTMARRWKGDARSTSAAG